MHLHFSVFFEHPKYVNPETYQEAMQEALTLAQKAENLGEVPVGAVLIHEQRVIARAHNLREHDRNPVAHAEILCLQQAAQQLNRWRLHDCTLVITLEPCIMCAGAILQARIHTVVFATHDLKAGAAGSLFDLFRDKRMHHHPRVITGVMQHEAQEQLQRFFAAKRLKR